MFKPRVGEIRQTVSLLESEHDDVEALALDVLNATADIVFKRDVWVVIMSNNLGVFVFGAFWTRRQAEDAMLHRITDPSNDKSKWFITRMMGVTDD